MNKKVVAYSIIALGCLILTFMVNWLFIVPVAVLVFLNQRELMN